MIVHLLRFAFRPEAIEQAKGIAFAALRRMAATDSVSFSIIGQDLGDDVYTHSYLVGIAEREAFERYLYAPHHRDVILAFAAPLAFLTAVDLSDDPNPGLADSMRVMHQGWLDRDPEIADLLASISSN